ncbi:DUF4180 domain-containing protein [Paraflavitalea speifideaquila]|uniref:DUF4180 domain-containing protein n=1 Tax=Paraflavitalea speifideaquila TaxID=3076558 RepID=UPI0028E8FE3B|nr:DUF4180 domain-containing protein [Paraflavitalea speifideiaquila]
MHIETHQVSDIKIAEITATGIVINTAADGLDLLGNLYYQEVDRIILHEQNITKTTLLMSNSIYYFVIHPNCAP